MLTVRTTSPLMDRLTDIFKDGIESNSTLSSDIIINRAGYLIYSSCINSNAAVVAVLPPSAPTVSSPPDTSGSEGCIRTTVKAGWRARKWSLLMNSGLLGWFQGRSRAPPQVPNRRPAATEHADIGQASCHHRSIFDIFEALKGGQLRAWRGFNEEHSTERAERNISLHSSTLLINDFITVRMS